MNDKQIAMVNLEGLKQLLNCIDIPSLSREDAMSIKVQIDRVQKNLEMLNV